MSFNKTSQENKEEQAVQQFLQQKMFNVHNAEEFESHLHLPLARIEQIIEADGETKMSAEAPKVLENACEVFIQEMVLRSWICAEERNRRTLLPCDLARAIQRSDVLYFLRGAVPIDDHHCCVHAEDDEEEITEKSAEEGTQSNPAGFVEPTKENMGNVSVK